MIAAVAARSRWVLVALLLGSVTTAPAAAESRALSGVAVPPGAVSRVLAADIVQNDRSTSIASLESVASVDDTLAFYRERWPAASGEAGHLEDRVGDWSILSRIEGRTLLVVQLREGVSGAEGFVSATALDVAPASAIPAPPLPAGGQLLSSTATRDGGRAAMTSIVSSTARPGEVAAFYRDRLVRDGWALVSERTHAGSPVLLLERRGARVEVVVADVGGRSVVVFNEVRLDG